MTVLPVITGLAIGLAFIAIVAIIFVPTNNIPRSIHPSPVPFTFVENLPKKIITADDAVLVARDHLDIGAQSGGEKAGQYRGGPLGSLELVYTHPDGSAYRLDKYTGSFAAVESYFDHRPRDTYFWLVILNYESQPNSPEYYFTINAETKEVIDLMAT